MSPRPVAPPVMLVPYLASLATALALVFALLPWNRGLFLAVNGANHPLLDPVALTVTMGGNGVVLAMILLLVARGSLSRAIRGLVALALAGGATQLVKFATGIPRPGAVLPDIHLIGPALMERSFPSGHASSAFAVAGVFLLAASTARGAVLPLLAAGAVAVSRIYVGAHYPADVAMGAFIGLAVAGIVTAAMAQGAAAQDTWGERWKGTVSPVAGVLYAGAGVFLLAFYRDLPGETRLPLTVAALLGLPVFFGIYSRISRR